MQYGMFTCINVENCPFRWFVLYNNHISDLRKHFRWTTRQYN